MVLLWPFIIQQTNEKQERVADRLLSLRTSFFWSRGTKKITAKEGRSKMFLINLMTGPATRVAQLHIYPHFFTQIHFSCKLRYKFSVAPNSSKLFSLQYCLWLTVFYLVSEAFPIQQGPCQDLLCSPPDSLFVAFCKFIIPQDTVFSLNTHKTFLGMLPFVLTGWFFWFSFALIFFKA